MEENKLKEREVGREGPGGAPGPPLSSWLLGKVMERTQRGKSWCPEPWAGLGERLDLIYKGQLSSRGGKSAAPSCDAQQKPAEKEEILWGRVWGPQVASPTACSLWTSL